MYLLSHSNPSKQKIHDIQAYSQTHFYDISPGFRSGNELVEVLSAADGGNRW